MANKLEVQNIVINVQKADLWNIHSYQDVFPAKTQCHILKSSRDVEFTAVTLTLHLVNVKGYEANLNRFTFV